jgi:hypothetical protein
VVTFLVTASRWVAVDLVTRSDTNLSPSTDNRALAHNRSFLVHTLKDGIFASQHFLEPQLPERWHELDACIASCPARRMGPAERVLTMYLHGCSARFAEVAT